MNVSIYSAGFHVKNNYKKQCDHRVTQMGTDAASPLKKPSVPCNHATQYRFRIYVNFNFKRDVYHEGHEAHEGGVAAKSNLSLFGFSS